MTSLMDRSFDQMDIEDLTVVLSQVNRRLLEIRANVPDVIFWFGIVCRLSKWINSEPHLNEVEKALLIGPHPPEINGRIRAVKHLRERSGMPLRHAAVIVDKWIAEHQSQINKDIS